MLYLLLLCQTLRVSRLIINSRYFSPPPGPMRTKNPFKPLPEGVFSTSPKEKQQVFITCCLSHNIGYRVRRFLLPVMNMEGGRLNP